MNKRYVKFTRLILQVFSLLLLSLLANPAAVSARGTGFTPLNINGLNPPWTISGNVGVAGVTLSYTDGGSQSVISDGSGNYALTVSDNWSGAVTPSLAGYTFTPDHIDYANVLADISGQDYTATPITFTISGNAGVAGAILSYTDNGPQTVTADSLGDYALTVSYNFSGSVTPSLAGYTFTPGHKTYTNVLADISGENYTTTPITFTISGALGAAGAGATLSYTDGTPKTATADGSGNYSFTVSYNFSGTVTPTKTGFTFAPVSITYANVLSNQTAQNYVTTPITPTISGALGVAGAGATLSYTDGTPKTATADGSGNYSFTVSYNFSGTVTPTKTGFSFSPTSRTYSSVVSNQTGQNYTTIPITPSISGALGVAGAGATLSYTDGTPKTATADGSGNYSFAVSYNFSGTVTPTKTGFSFSPTSRTYSSVVSNQTGQDYTTTPITFTISGALGVAGAGATLSYTDGTPKTATADGSGNYSFAVSYNFSGTVTPTKTGFSFSPTSITYASVLSNQTAQNYVTTPITFTISGALGAAGAGATLSYTDSTPKTATADGSGNYSFTVSYNFSGTVTPTKTGFSFSPTSITYASVLSNQTAQNYVTTPITFTISGALGAAGAGATLSYTDGTPKTATADGSGNYSFTVSYNFSGTVTPTKTGFTFTPASITYTSVLSNQTAQNYTTTAITFTISGNAGIAGATLSYTDVTPKTATADGSGNYSFTVSYNFSGTVTPSLAGYTFSPATRTYINVLANQTAQNYTALVSISGNAGIAGATLSYTDGTPKTATADGSGNYSFTVIYNWSGTVTPSLAGYTFSPATRTYTNILVNQTAQNYTALVSISGNAGIAGATLSYTDGTPKTATADGSGNYSFTVSYNFSGTVTPSLTGYTFSPTTRTYTSVLVNQTAQNYTALVSISGNAGIAGATLSYTDGTPKTATADGSGNYSFTVIYNWSGTVTPSLIGYTFSPANKTYTNVLVNQTAQNYTALVSISGNVGISGATLGYTDGTPKTAIADTSGNYSFTVIYNWSGTVTPSLAGYTFSPASKTYTNVLANQTAQNYTALVSISGNAGIAGATLSYTDGTLKTATADGSGNYSFTVIYNWSGTVTPSLAGYTFSPASKTYTNVLVNQTAQNYTALVSISGNVGIAGATLSYTDGTPKTATADGSGNYSFTVSYNWSGTVTPTKTGFTFSPASKTYTHILVNQTAQNYTALVSISGNVGIAGVTLSFTDGTAKTVSSDGSGNYSLIVTYNWSGTVTPTKPGFTFSPVNRTYSHVVIIKTAQNYTPTAITFTISGNAGVAGATLSYTDGTSKTATADGSGNYSFTVSYNWSGLVTPSKLNYGFTPANKAYTNVLENRTAENYVAVLAYSISGSAGVAGAVLSYTDGTAKAVTSDGSGNYLLTVSHNWTGDVTPAKSGCIFNPTFGHYTNVTGDLPGQNYSAACVPPAATLIAPNGTVYNNFHPTYVWNQVNIATWYYLYVKDSGGNKVIGTLYQSLPSLCNGTTCSITPATTLSVGTYTWYIDGWNSLGYGPYSTGMSFTTTTQGPSNSNVYIGGSLQGNYQVFPGQSTRVGYAGMNNGPVQVISTNGTNIIASQRVAYTPDGGATWPGFSELMGLPANQLTTAYVMPFYNNVDLNTQLRFGNVGPSSTTVTVRIAGVDQGTYQVDPDQSYRVSYAGLNNGPVLIFSSGGVPIIASERVAYTPDGGTTWPGYSELMGLPAGQLTNSYAMPWYNNNTLNSQLRFGNMGSSTTTVTVIIGGVVQGVYQLDPNQSVRVSYAGLDSGPVQIISSGGVPIIASERVAYTSNGGATWPGFSELMGLPASQLTTSYEMPWYNNADLNTQLRFGNVGLFTTTVTVTIGGVVQGTYPLDPNQSYRISYPGLNSGPVQISSSGGVPIIASQRVAYTPDGGATWPGFSELMGLPSGQLTTTYVMPWYNNSNLNTQLRFGVP